MLDEIFDLDSISFVAYKNSGDEQGVSIPYTINDDGTIDLPFDVMDNTCLEFNVMLSERFRSSGEQAIFRISTDTIINTETGETDQMMMFRSQIVSYDNGIETKEKEDEKMLCPDCDMCDDTFVLNVGDCDTIDAFNIDVWGNINGTNLNANRRCVLNLKLESYKLGDNLNRLGLKTIKKAH